MKAAFTYQIDFDYLKSLHYDGEYGPYGSISFRSGGNNSTVLVEFAPDSNNLATYKLSIILEFSLLNVDEYVHAQGPVRALFEHILNGKDKNHEETNQ